MGKINKKSKKAAESHKSKQICAIYIATKPTYPVMHGGGVNA